MTHVEMIIDYVTDGTDFQYSDNHGVLTRCRDCRYWQDNNGGYPHDECRWNKDETPDEDDYCSCAERREVSELRDFVKERDAAFIHFVKTDDLSQVKAYCKKWGVQIPKDKKVMMAGVYKAVVATTSIPGDIKTLAMQKCLALGFNPFIHPIEPEDTHDRP